MPKSNPFYQPASNLLVDWLNQKTFYPPQILKNEEKLNQLAFKKALSLFHAAADRIPAYKDFLQEHKIKPKHIKTLADFDQIPFTTKKNYIENYPLDARTWDQNISSNHMVSTSSGTTGTPNFWPRDIRAEIEGAQAHEYIFSQLCDVTSTKPSLLLIGFAMGNWIAGTFTQACAQLNALKGLPLTTTTPGYSSEAIISLLQHLPPYYQNIIITGHTPFLKALIEDTIAAGIDWSQYKVQFLGTGQAVTESWRQYLIDQTQQPDYYRTFYNLYGSADAALMGFETPLSILLRQSISQHPKLVKQVFHQPRIPTLVQYDPRLTYFQSHNQELIITKYSGIPLIRYNIQDHGDQVNHHDFIQSLPNINLKPDLKRHHIPSHQLPFVYVFGRDKFMVKIFGANIYSEHVQEALNHPSLQSKISGNFKLVIEYDQDHNPKLICHTEQHPHHQHTLKELIQEIEAKFIHHVTRLSDEYKDALSRMGNKAKPKIILHPFGDPTHFPKDKIKKTA